MLYDEKWVLEELEFLVEAGVIERRVVDGQVFYERRRLLTMTSERARESARRLEASARFYTTDHRNGVLQ